MTQSEFEALTKLIEAARERAKTDTEYRKQIRVKSGIYNSDGTLTKIYSDS